MILRKNTKGLRISYSILSDGSPTEKALKSAVITLFERIKKLSDFSPVYITYIGRDTHIRILFRVCVPPIRIMREKVRQSDKVLANNANTRFKPVGR